MARVGAPPALAVSDVTALFSDAGSSAPSTTDASGPGAAGAPDATAATTAPSGTAGTDGSAVTGAPAAVGPSADEDGQRTLLLIVGDEGARPASLTLLAGTADDGQPTLLHIPVGTLAQIPGFGLERLGSAAVVGDAELVEATVENALGLDIDARSAVTPDLLADFLDRVGGLEIDLPVRIVDRSGADGAQVLFSAGRQQLDGQAARRLWTASVDGDDEFDRVARQQLVWDALLDRLGSDATARARALADGAPQLRPDGLAAGDAGADLAATLIDELAVAHGSGDLGVELLPVTVLGGDDAQPSYRVDEDELDEIVNSSLASSRPATPTAGRVRVQILNGVGTPGIGREVDRLLDGEPVRVVRSDNAKDFDQEATRILIYGDDPAIRAAAEQVRARLGVGTIELSRQPQSVVDLTIVVGGDFTEDAAR